MKVGTIVEMPGQHTQFARIRDERGNTYTVNPNHVPQDAAVGEEFAYKVEIWSGSGGIAYDLEEE